MSGRWIQMIRIDDRSSESSTTLDPQIVAGMVSILIPTLFIVSLIVRRRSNRKTMQQQIAQLERSWQLKSTRNLSN